VRELLNQYFTTLDRALRKTEVIDCPARLLSLEDGVDWMRRSAHAAHDRGNKIIFIGNGGSAGIASHLGIDFFKNGCLRSLAFNDASALTCLGSDLGYEKCVRQTDGLPCPTWRSLERYQQLWALARYC
jgi:D-sedoheptulose 7-phosphate isomerase